MPTPQTVAEFANACRTLTNDQIYELFENEIDDLLKQQLYDLFHFHLHDAGHGEPVRDTLRTLGKMFDVQPLIEY